jgi:hypothetical protein
MASIRRSVGLARKGMGELVRSARTLNATRTRQMELMEETHKELVSIRRELFYQREYLNVLRYEAFSSTGRQVKELTDKVQYDLRDTLELVAERKLSFARFGDGEFRTMFRYDYNLAFQPNSPRLRAALKRVLSYDGYDPEQLLIGLPHPYLQNLHWQSVWLDMWEDFREVVDPSMKYGDAHVTRPVFFEQLPEDGVDLWRNLWDDKRVCVVTGRNSRFELLDEFFGNVRDADFIHSVPTNAFEDVPRLVDEIKKTEADLFLIALGPAGTVLAAEASNAGKWAVDTGHLSNSWQHQVQKAPLPEKLPRVIGG